MPSLRSQTPPRHPYLNRVNITCEQPSVLPSEAPDNHLDVASMPKALSSALRQLKRLYSKNTPVVARRGMGENLGIDLDRELGAALVR
jgi:hypothetical protein